MIKIDTQTITWTMQFFHAAKIHVYRTLTAPPSIYTYFAEELANGSLAASCPVGSFQLGQVTGFGYAIPGGEDYQYGFSLTLSYAGGSQTIRFTLPPGVYAQPSIGTMTITAPCDVYADLETLGEGDGAGFVGFHHRGFQRDTPDSTRCRMWLRLREAATWRLETNYATYTGTCGSAGADLPNTLTAYAQVTAISGLDTAEGRINITCTNGSYQCDSVSRSWSADGGSCSCVISDGSVIAAASPSSGGYAMTSEASCSWNLSREALLNCAVLNTAGSGIPADLLVTRHANDTKQAGVTAANGYYAETITQRAWSWHFSGKSALGATHDDSGSWNNWGDLAVSLNPTWSIANEYHNLPSDWSDYTGYLNWQDNRMLMHLWAMDGPILSHAAVSSLGLGWVDGGYEAVGGTYQAKEPQRYGRWTAANATMTPNGNMLSIVPASGAVSCTLRRTLEWSTDQCGDNPTRSPRPTFAGYRYLRIHLHRSADPAPDDTVTVRIKQDNLASLYPDPSTMSWQNPSLVVKSWTTKVKADGSIEIDLARPDSTGLVAEGNNPPPLGNHGELAIPNTLSRWPRPTLDGTLSGVTLPEYVEVEFPATNGDTWQLGSVELFRKHEPIIHLLPPLNQWIREERHDQRDDTDTTQRRHWRRRLLLAMCDGLPNLELFDMVRTSSHSTSEELGEYDIWQWELKSVAGVAVQAAEVFEVSLWQFGDPDSFTPVGRLQYWPGWSITIPTPTEGSLEQWIQDGIGCRWGGHGVIWLGSAPQVQVNIPVSSSKLQVLADAVDWFAGLDDPFGFGDSGLVVRAATVLHGLAAGGGMDDDAVQLCAGDAIVQTVSTDAEGRLLAANPGGKHLVNHDLKRGGTVMVSWSPELCTWEFRPSMEVSQVYPCSEAPLWWHSRGVHIAHWAKWFGPLRLRRNRQGKLICQKRTLEGAGRCVRCKQG